MRRLMLPLLFVLALPVAEARVGGGHSYSAGSHSSSSAHSSSSYSSGSSFHSSGSGGGSGVHSGLDTVFVIVIIGILVFARVGSRSTTWRSSAFVDDGEPETPAPSRPPSPGTGAIRAADPNFSEPLFLDFAQLVYARAMEIGGTEKRALLKPWFSATALQELAAQIARAGTVGNVIFGVTRLRSARVDGPWAHLVVDLETNFTGTGGHAPEQMLSKERWTFSRRADALSPGPEAMQSGGCASCGSTAEPKSDGACPNCGASRVGGATQWEVRQLQVIERQALGQLELSLGGGDEPGLDLPTVIHPRLGTEKRAFEARHPETSWRAFEKMATHAFQELQDAWSSGKWERARPFETDALFQVHRFWIERYKRFGLHNRSSDVRVTRVELARIDHDAFLETVTVRIFASMNDWTEDQGGHVVGDSQDEARRFSEYWTFIRAIGGKPPAGSWEKGSCPSCGAPLDKLSMAGVCGYCDAKITTGSFDWVLSRIEQDDAY